jgi:hypothetical protein
MSELFAALPQIRHGYLVNLVEWQAQTERLTITTENKSALFFCSNKSPAYRIEI